MKSLIKKIKSELDHATWTFEACGSHNYSDVEKKVLPFLDKCKWSEKVIEAELKDCYNDGLELAKDRKIKSEDLPKLFANYIASSLAFQRVNRYQWSPRSDRYRLSNKWYINETVSFHIV